MVDYNSLAKQLKLLAHPERLGILDALRHEPECVCHLEVLLGKPQPYISQQLRLLREANIIVDEKEGLNVYYRVIDAAVLTWLESILGVMRPPRHQPLIGCPCPKCGSVVIQLT